MTTPKIDWLVVAFWAFVPGGIWFAIGFPIFLMVGRIELTMLLCLLIGILGAIAVLINCAFARQQQISGATL